MNEYKKLAFADIKEEILSSINILEFIENEYGVFCQPGSNGWYQTNCLMPKHRDNNPSFGIHPETGKFNCLSCKSNGDLITLVRKVEGLSFYEALQRLAEYAGISTDQSSDAQLNRVVRQIARDITGYLNGGHESLYPAQMTEPEFMCAVASRLRKYEQSNQDIEWVELKYTELDSLIEDCNYTGCEKFWNNLSADVKSRKNLLTKE